MQVEALSEERFARERPIGTCGHGWRSPWISSFQRTIMLQSSATPRGATPSATSMCMSMSKAADPERYRGFIREAKFGEVVLTDILLSEQRIRRNNQHISKLDKDCYYIQLVHKGNISVVQRRETHRSNAARGAIFLSDRGI